ncbi:MAG: hypothetical protein A3C85_03120 [Candidatus Doudnabacteria bacterium RIFCSPHIGHO2_02_FULL_48_21]|uniref:Prepilin peptidase n=1 Tax=Candidatus Doudnabacteria bacterium RIFCSPLOWO2_02_FULL_48_13 TaxID=1817845 RepID=A0A1F5QC23_9BACT|nr:MAG: hypothetical protein A3K05_00380 [Candidatus Doudnabacteria bacterium RIFCSPHIGHO2_01_48_18]OGE77722.1 MAG: hypothetical protein A2668_02930 [Candidatus Doudnabacteria bacterium RIFCSPHIGHO2_01_FULL_48_180]OGE91637.1 MAG: hypothetical protein A3F44_02950 [Candidatus Doudnabacteria bacterium RIFCSPHIGHO2_12_FULL_47_25]OGE93251.1 MAG: hypothetical protein A3C85_03120 [Candidatus Doudnabacteria bacterium RIFCSPHIGHO2_02_FULL_48_21]OGE99734.1 MAG: hypothetical protein A3J05_01880 [Candidatu
MALVSFVFGLIVGSFLNALIYRLGSCSRSIFDKDSVCPKCQHVLAWSDLIPVVSFFLLGGKCRYCRKKISRQYPLVELATGTIFLLIAQNFQFSIFNFQFLAQLVFACFLIVIFVYDLKHYLILDKVVLPAAILAAAYQLIAGQLLNGFYGALILSGFFWILYLLSRGRAIGFGDVKLGVFLGLLVPFPQTIALFFLSYMSGAVVSIILMAIGVKSLKDRLPFGTFLTFAAFVAMLWGEEFISWYFYQIGIR